MIIQAEIQEVISFLRRNTDKLHVGLWGFANSLVIPAYGVFAVLVVFRVMPKGELGTYFVLQNIYILTVQLGFSFAFLPLVRHFFDPDSRQYVVAAGIALNILFISPILVVLSVFRGQIGRLFSCPAFTSLVVPLVAAVVLRSLAELRIAILQALHRTREVFTVNMVYHVVLITVIGRLAVANDLHQASQLVWALVWAAGASAATAFIIAPRGVFHPVLCLAWVKRMFHFGKYTLGSGLSGAVFTRMDVLLLSAFKGPPVVAAYGVAKIFTRIFDLYSHTGNLVLFPFFSRLWSEDRHREMRRLYRAILISSNVVILPLVSVLMVGASPAVRFFYGTKYPSAGVLLAVFALVGLTVPWRTLGQSIINAAGTPRYVLAARIIISVFNLLLDILLIPRFGALGAIIATLASLTVLAVVLTSKARGVLPFREDAFP